MTDVPTVLVDTTLENLRPHAPFDRMDAASLRFLAGKVKLAYFARGKVIVSPDHGAARSMWIVQRGLVHAVDPGAGNAAAPVEYAGGECFPLGAVIGNRPVRRAYVAAEDTFCYEVDADVVDELARRSSPFQAFCYDRASALLKQSYAQLQSAMVQESAAQQPLNARLRDLVRRKPLACAPERSLQAALEAMQREKVGSIVIVDGGEAPIGIFTERDLLRHTVAGGIDLSQAIETRMTRSPRVLDAAATAAEAALLMVQLGIRHVVVVEEGRLLGVVSERDLFALQRTSMRAIIHGIEIATDLADLQARAAAIRKLANNLLAQGVAAEQLTQLIATLNDRLTARILTLEAAKTDLAGLRCCWIALGSEGRMEQTLATDQDNGIIFSGGLPPAEARARLLPFAQAVNAALDACGFPLCKGKIMAGNPEWCLSLGEWQEKFDEWIRDPLPAALLHSSIFFDFRPAWGEDSLARELRTWLNARLRGDQRFLRAMAQAALESRPPLGMFSGFVTSAGEGGRNTIDLKAQGTRAFVDAARIFALASGLAQTNTAARLRLSGEKLNVPLAEVEAMVDAFHFILLLRLRRGQGEAGAGGNANHADPEEFNSLDRRILVEAFRHARKLQTRLSLDYRL